MKTALMERGTLPLFLHQAQAINAVRKGDNVALITPTASGKSLCYHVPVLESCLADATVRALYISPTKALAQDQLRSISALARELPRRITIATYDGDTPTYERADVRREAAVILTNPDMLHLAILPNHTGWSRFFRGLRYVIVDEGHIYRGVFGSHMANVLRRLRRVAHIYGSRPQFILASATLGNPQKHPEMLTGLPMTVVDEDGSPYGGKDFLLWNPPFLDQAKTARRSATREVTDLFTELVGSGVRTLAFTRTRRLAELIYRYAHIELSQTGRADLAERISPYRAGYTPEERREIESALAEGGLLGVTATNALELGIDIGDLDATLLTGFPGTVASTVQQAGRSGRRGARSLSVLVGQDNPLDQYLLRHPEMLFGRPHEHALLAPTNPHILTPHLLCAAYESPLRTSDAEYFGPDLVGTTALLEAQGLLRERRGRWFPSPDVPYPAEGVNIRSSSNTPVTVLERMTGRVLETVDGAVALFELHPGAIYLHRGEEYLIEELDLEAKTAYAVSVSLPYFTQSMDTTDLQILRPIEKRKIGEADVTLGEVDVSTTVIGYKKKKHVTEEVLEMTPLDLPPIQFPTVALWWDVPKALLDKVEEFGLDVAGGLHAAEHAAIGLLPLFAMCDRQDIGGLSTPMHPDTGQATIFIYDGHPGGIGIAERGYEIVLDLWQATLDTIRGCPCEGGCPSCVQSPKCGNNNEPLDKAAAALILEELLKGAGT
jgi:DEAD/DEAH box helicase domain-containing protein